MPERTRRPRATTDLPRDGEAAETAKATPVADRSPEESTADGRPDRRRLLGFALLCLVCALVGGGYALRAAREERAARSDAPVADAATLAAVRAGPHLVFLESDGALYGDGTVAVLSLDALDAPRLYAAERCQRVHAGAGAGICLGAGAELLRTGGAQLLGPDFAERASLPAAGLPSRARVSPDGRWAAMTLFVYGDSYAAGSFSTRTSIVDVAAGMVVGDLESFAVLRDGGPFQAVDFNFWGVTFARGGDRFYATLGTGGKTYLVEGDIAARQMRTLKENVECPSLSPDGRRLAFKKRIGDGPVPVWRLHLLDLTTMRETPLGETRNVDDQVEWLDDGHILYSPPAARPEIWVAAVDGGEPPRLLLTRALSPAVVR